MSEEVLLTDPQKDKEIVEDFAYDMYVQPVAGAVLGCFELTLSFLTCCASCCEFRKLLRIVGTIFFVFSIIMVIFVMLAFKKLEKVAEIEETVGNVMLRNLNHLYNQVKEDTLVSRFTFELNGLQVLLGCCGLFGYHDYENATLWKSGVGMNLTVPETCCKVNRYDFLLGGEINFENGNCTQNPNSTNAVVDRGCAKAIFDDKRWKLLIGTIVLSSISLFFQLETIAFFVCQIQVLHHEKQDVSSELRAITAMVLKEVEANALEIQLRETGDNYMS
ncbi:hypothetical protein V1264_003293 [Littorina saxatilis]